MSRAEFKTLSLLPWDTGVVVRGASLCPVATGTSLARCEEALLLREYAILSQNYQPILDDRIHIPLFLRLLRVHNYEDALVPSDAGNFSRFCQHLLVYRLFDIANRLCHQPSRLAGVVPEHARQPFSIRKKFYGFMSNWVKLVKDAHHAIQNEPSLIDSPTSVNLPASSVAESHQPSPSGDMMFEALEAVAELTVQSSRNSIYANMLLAAIHIRYLVDGHVDLPDDANAFYSHVERSAKRPRQRNWTKSIQQLRLPLQLALAISPICLLVQKQLISDKCSREELLVAWQALGNIRPDAVRKVEDAIWNSLLRIVQHTRDYKIETAALVHKIQSDIVDVSEQDQRWFQSDDSLKSIPSFERRKIHVEWAPADWPHRPLLLPPQQMNEGKEGGHEAAEEGGGADPTGVEERGGDDAPAMEERSESHPMDIDEDEDMGGMDPDPRNEEDGGSMAGNMEEARAMVLRKKYGVTMGADGEDSAMTDAAATYNLRRQRKRQSKGLNTAAPVLGKRKRTGCQPARKREQATVAGMKIKVPKSRRSSDYLEIVREWDKPGSNLDLVPIEEGPPEQPQAHKLYGTSGHITYSSRLPFESDQDFLSSAVECVSKFFLHGVPCHISNPGASAFHLVKYEDFRVMTASQLQKLYRTHHIVVTGMPIEDNFAFNRQRLEDLGSWLTIRSIQDLSIPVENCDFSTRVRSASFREIYEHSKKEDGRILNCLDIPLPDGSPTDRRLASDMKAWKATMGNPLCSKEEEFPLHESRWALAATAHAMHRWHIDAEGVGTTIEVKTGAKWWAVARPKPGHADIVRLNDDQLWCFEPDAQNEGLWDHEAILLVPGMMLFMRPNTPHMVVTTDHSICYGTHFIASGAIRQTCFGLIHTFVRRDVVTNAENRKAWHSLQRLLLYYREMYITSCLEDPEVDISHVPACQTLESAADLLTFCAVMELGLALYPGFYDDNGIDKREWSRFIQAREATRDIVEWFDAHFCVSSSTDLSAIVAPYSYILLSMSLTVIRYIEKQKDWEDEDAEEDPAPIEATLYEVLEVLADHDELEPLVAGRCEYILSDFNYPGANFHWGTISSVENPEYTPPAINSRPDLEWERLQDILEARKDDIWPQPRLTVDEFLGRKEISQFPFNR